MTGVYVNLADDAPADLKDSPNLPEVLVEENKARPYCDSQSRPIPEEPYVDGMILGIVTVPELPEPTGLDWVKDSIANALKLERGKTKFMGDEAELTVYPDPSFEEELQLKLVAHRAETVSVHLLDVEGHLLSSETWNISTGQNEFTLRPDVNHGVSVLYLRLTDLAGRSVTKAVFKTRLP